MVDSSELRYAVRLRVLARYFGQLSVVFSALMLIPLIVSLLCRDYGLSLRYSIIAVGSILIGFCLSKIRAPRSIQVNEGMVIVALAFLMASLAMTLPMTSTGMSFIDALFEAISGITTTGLSTVSEIEETPSAFLFSRSWLQWYGGLGFVVLSLALVFSPSQTSKDLAVTESDPEDLPGSTQAHARRMLLVYSLITLVLILILWPLLGNFFEALIYSFTSVSTGGYSPHSGSLSNLTLETQAVITLGCFLGAIPFTFFRRHQKKNEGWSVGALQLFGLLISSLIATLFLCLTMRWSSGMSWMESMQHAPMLALSAQTTAGFSTTSVSELDSGSKLFLIFTMLIGGGVGSTAGGIKILRLLIIFRLLQVLITRTSLPENAVYEPRFGQSRLGTKEIQNALLLSLLYPLCASLSWIPFIISGYDPLDSLFEVVSAVSTVGLSSGITASELPAYLKLILCANMLFGRLECMAWIVFFYPRTWIGRRRRMI